MLGGYSSSQSTTSSSVSITMWHSRSPFYKVQRIDVHVWFKFILGLSFTSLCFKLITILYHNPKTKGNKIQTKDKIEPQQTQEFQ